MIGQIGQKLEEWMVAAAFAEAGDHKTARAILASRRRDGRVARKRIRRDKRVELRAPGVCP